MTSLFVPAEAATVATPTDALDAYIDQTFGITFQRSGPTELVPPDPKNKLGIREPSIVLEVNVTYRDQRQLTEDLQFPSSSEPDVTLKQGTTLYKTRLRRSAEDAATFDVWCGPYQFTYGRVRNQTGWNLVCLQELKNGQTGAYFQPHPVTYMNGTAITTHHSRPPIYASELREQAVYDVPFPSLAPATETAPPMQLLLAVERPENQPHTSAYWVLSPSGTYASYKVRLENARVENNRLRIRLGDTVLQTEYLPQPRHLTAPQIDMATDRDLPTHPFVPLINGPGYANYYDPSGATLSTARDEPWRLGTLRLKPETLSIASEPLRKDQTLLTVKAQRVDRQKIINQPPPSNGSIQFLNNNLAYEWVRPGYQADGTVYVDRLLCGIGQSTAILVTNATSICTPLSPLNGLGQYGRQRWDISARDRGDFHSLLSAAYIPYQTVADPDPAPTEFTVEIKVDSGDEVRAELRIGLQEGGKFNEADRIYRDFDKNGIVRIYLWDKVIYLRRDEKTFIAEVEDTDTGYGPFYDLPAK